MGKHLSIQEKLNAENELKEIALKIKIVRTQIKLVDNNLQKEELKEKLKQYIQRRKKLQRHIYFSKQSIHNGKYGINGICFNMFGKKACELNKEERTEYNRVMKAKQRERTGNVYDREYSKIYDLTHKEEKRERNRLWAIKNKDKIKQYNLKRRLEKQKQRGYGPHEGSWTFKTFGKRYKDMTEEEKVIQKRIYNKTKAKEMGNE